jgi:hypothetical protein
MFERDEETKFMSVPKSIADLLESEMSIETIKSEIKRKYEHRRDWFIDDLKNLESEADRFKAIGAIHKASLDEALGTQEVAIEEVAAKLADGFFKATEKAREIKKLAEDTKKTVEDIMKISPNNYLYQAERLFNVIETFNRMDEESKNLLEKLLKL